MIVMLLLGDWRGWTAFCAGSIALLVLSVSVAVAQPEAIADAFEALALM